MRDEAGVRNPVLPDLLRPGLRIVFLGERTTNADKSGRIDHTEP
jgi:hypothetical protein